VIGYTGWHSRMRLTPFLRYINEFGLQFGYRSRLYRGPGGVSSIGLTVTEEDDYELRARIMRFGRPLEQAPVLFGVGLGVMGARVDRTGSELGAITMTGSAEYVLALDYPVRFVVEGSYAPNAATFGDGERVLDLLARVEADVSGWGTGFVGFRHLEVDIDDARDAEIEDSFHIGVRLGL